MWEIAWRCWWMCPSKWVKWLAGRLSVCIALPVGTVRKLRPSPTMQHRILHHCCDKLASSAIKGHTICRFQHVEGRPSHPYNMHTHCDVSGTDVSPLFSLCHSAGWRSLTEDHRIAGNPTEAARLTAKNHNVPGGVSTRLYGLNIARMLGDRFLKEQDVGFTAEPYISEGIVLGPDDEAVLLVASDGLWDVVSQERAAAMAGKTVAHRAKAAESSSAGTAAAHAGAEQAQESSTDGAAVSADVSNLTGGQGDGSTVAAAVAEALMHAALSLRSRDDISVMVLHVLPAEKAEHGAAVGTTGSGSI